MKTRMMFFLILSVCMTSKLLNAQKNDSIFMQLNKRPITTGILYNTTYNYSNIDSYDGISDSICTFNNWKQIYYEINNSMLYKMSNIPSLQRIVDLKNKISNSNNEAVPLAIMNINFNRIKSYALDSNLIGIDTNGNYYDIIGNTKSPYEEKKVIAFTAFMDKLSYNYVEFYVGKEFYFSNSSTLPLNTQIDFDDGLGYRTVSFGQTIKVNYSTLSDKVLKLKLSFANKTYNAITILATTNCTPPYLPDIPPWGEADPDYKWRIEADIPYLGAKATGNAYIKYHDDNDMTLKKPFILVEGIDFGMDHSPLQNGTLGFCGIFGGNDPEYSFLSEYPYLIEDLRQRGYDVILLDFYDGVDYIQRNAMLLVKLIKLINQYKITNEQIVVAGASMGGQVARYALSYMEKNNMPHCAKMYISVDSPHQGANIPLGLQNMFKFLGGTCGNQGAQDAVDNKLGKPASKQLMVYQIFSDGLSSFRNPYISEMNDLGYPKYVRKLGIANGTINGVGQSFNAGDQLLDWYWHTFICVIPKTAVLHEVWAINNSGGIIYNGKHPPYNKWDGICTHTANTTTIATGFAPLHYDNAPGGMRNTVRDAVDQINDQLDETSSPKPPHATALYDNHCFIPTISALDINTSNLFLNVKNALDNHLNTTPFDAVCAPLGTNEMHSQATLANRTFVLDQIYLNENILVSPLTNQTFNYGRKEFANFNSLVIGTGGILKVNATGNTGYNDIITTIDGSTFTLQTCYCDNIVVEIGNNGQMILGESSPNNKAIVKFLSGSTLKIGAGGKLKINDNSKLIIEQGATIIIEQGAQIELNGTNAVLEIRGTTEIGDNAIFTFTGTGFIRYNVSDQNNPSIITGTNSKMILQGTGQTNLVLEINGTLWPEDNLTEFRISNGAVHLIGGLSTILYSNLNLGCSYKFVNTRLYGIGGLTVWGAAHSLIAGCEFDGVSITGNLFVYDNILKIRNTTIKNLTSGTGLTTWSEGVELYNVTFDNCDIGWNSPGLLKPSIVSGCNFSNATYGILIDNSAALSNLLVKESTINNNTVGISFSGRGILNVKCSNINYNYNGIDICCNSALSMSAIDNTGNVDLSNNSMNIYLEKARALYIDQGFNKLFYHAGLEAGIPVITGTIYNTCTNPNLLITANNNQWNSQDYDMPGIYKYSLGTFNYDCQNVSSNYSIVGNNGIPITSCGTTPNPVPINYNYSNALKYCKVCDYINTTNFQNVQYNVAIDSTISMMNLEDSLVNDLPTINRFNQILMSPLDSSNTNMLWLADLAFTKMNVSLANAFKTGRITEADNVDSLHPSVQEVIDVYNRFTKTVDQSNSIEQFYLQYSKAQVYSLAGRRDIALDILDSINLSNCYIGQSELRILKSTQKLINAEQLIITGVVPREKFDSLYTPYIPSLHKQIDSTATIDSTAQMGNMTIIGNSSIIGQNVIIAESVSIGNNVTIDQNTEIGYKTIIGNNTTVGKYVIVGKNCVIGDNVKLKNGCIIGDNVIIADSVELDSINKIGSYVSIDSNSKFKEGCLIAEGSIIGANNNFENNVKIGSNVIIRNSANIYAHVNIGDGSIIGNNIMINGYAKIGSNSVINDSLTLGSNSKVCDSISLNYNLADFQQIGSCDNPTIPSTALQVQINYEFAIARAKKVGNFFNGFNAINIDTSKHVLCTNNKINFASDLLSTNYLWNFGDCSTSNDEAPVHEYTKPGIYTVTLTIYNFCAPVQYIGAITILPGEIEPLFNTLPVANCILDSFRLLDKNNAIVDLSQSSCYTDTLQCKSFSVLDSSLIGIKFNWDFDTIRQPLEEIFTIKQLANNSDSILKCFFPQSGEYPISLKATLLKKDLKENTWVNTEITKTFNDTINLKNLFANFEYENFSCYTDTIMLINKTTGGEKPFTFHWNFGNGITSTAKDTQIIYTSQGTYNISLIATDNNGCSDTTNLFITANAIPLICGKPIGDTSICINAANTIYTTTGATYSTYYSWEINPSSAGIIINDDTSATVDWDSLFSGTATIKVQGMNSCGDGPVSDSLNINVIPLLATPGTISGTDTVCPGQNDVTYTIPAVANASSYIWSLPFGAIGNSASNSITVNYDSIALSGNITVKGSNFCGDGIFSSYPVIVNPLPSAAGIINGTATICQGQNNVIYIIPAIENASSYIWSLPSGAIGNSTSNNITVNYDSSSLSGIITVKGSNFCGNGISSFLVVSVNPVPNTPIIHSSNDTIFSNALTGNQWYNSSGIIEGEVNTYFIPQNNGNYYVIVNEINCLSDTSNTINYYAYIHNYFLNKIRIYPNPSKNQITIENNSEISHNYLLSLKNVQGQEVISEKINFAKAYSIDVSSLSNGVYILNLQNEKENFISKIVIKN